MTQPGVSQHLIWLEEYFGCKLIERERKSFEITEAGLKVLSYAKDLFADHERFKRTVAEDNPRKGPCRFASPGSFGIKMYSFLLSLNKQNPELSIHYSYAPNATVINSVLEDKIDIGFATINSEDARLETSTFATENLCLILPKKQHDKSFAALKSLGFIDHPDGNHHATRLLSANFSKEFENMEEIPVRGFNNQINRILEPVAFGLGFTALPEFACRSFPRQSSLQYLDLKNPVSDPIYMIKKKRKTLPKRYDFILEQYSLQETYSKR